MTPPKPRKPSPAMPKSNIVPLTSTVVLEGRDAAPVPFQNAEAVWFWFIEAWTARQEGARITAGAGTVMRPCEPIDIFAVLERLHRNRRLLRDHLLVLRHYGRRLAPPDARRPKEMRAHRLWKEAFEILTPALERKGIIVFRNWLKEEVPT